MGQGRMSSRVSSYVPILFVFIATACVRPDTAANSPGEDVAALARAAAPLAATRNGADAIARLAPKGPGRSAQEGLPVATLTFVNPDGGRSVFEAEVASTEAQRATGLMFRKELPVDSSMLFVFQDEAVRSFYMKNTYVALDMIFVGANGVVVGVVENTRPLTLDSRGVDQPARFVVEINAWEAGRRGIRAGSVMTASPSSVLAF